MSVITLTTPAAIQLTSIFAFFKFTAVIEAKTLDTLCYMQYWMHTNDFFSWRSRTNVRIAACTMQTTFGHRINVGVRFNKIFLFFGCCVIFELQFKAYFVFVCKKKNINKKEKTDGRIGKAEYNKIYLYIFRKTPSDII